MYYSRALSLLSLNERKLIQDFFDQDGGQLTSITSLEPGPAKSAYAHYGRVMEDVIKHVRKRKTEAENILISMPVFILLQPDLSFMEKHLLADVWGLQKGPLGCFKSNTGFALELGTTEGNVADMIYRLRQASFLDEHEGKKGERVLRLSKGFLGLIGQSPLMDSSVPTDELVSGHLPERQSPLTKASVPTDDVQGQNLNETPMDIDDSAEGDAPNLQGDIKINQQQPQAEARQGVVVAEKTKTGAAAPEPPPRGAGHNTSPAKGASRPTAAAKDQPADAPPAHPAKALPEPVSNPEIRRDAAKSAAAEAALATRTHEREARKLLQVFEKLYRQFFDRDYNIQPHDEAIAIRYFRDHPARTALEVANYLVCAWSLRDEQDGDYGYGCCKAAKSVEGFFKYLERDDGKNGIVEDVENNFDCYWNGEDESLLKSLKEICPKNQIINEVFADVVGQISRSQQAEAEAEAQRSAEVEKEREQAEKQAEAAREAARVARMNNPSADDLKLALGTLSSLYETALGIRKGNRATQRQVDFAREVLRCDPPALREWYEHYGSGGLARTSSENAVPTELRTRLKRESDELSDVVAELSSASSGPTADSTLPKESPKSLPRNGPSDEAVKTLLPEGGPQASAKRESA